MATPELSDPRAFNWTTQLSNEECSRIVLSPSGEMIDDGDWYLDASSPNRGPVLALEGEFVPLQGVYIRRSKNGEELWGRLTLAASGKL